MDVRGTKEYVYPWTLSLAHRFPADVYILLNGSGKASDARLLNLLGHILDRLGISR